jgi:nitrogen regulatory protein P-II 1
MKLVTAMIKPARLDDLHQELEQIGVSGMTVTEVRSLGRRHKWGEICRGAGHQIDLLPRYKVEVVVGDLLAEAVVETIRRIAGVGGRELGELFELEVGWVVRIRTGETDLNAI